MFRRRRVVVPPNGPRIVIVGVCASGKTVLANALQALGYKARAMAQEHSFVPGMWRAHGQPNVLVCLDAEAETVNRRLEREDWTAAAIAEQRGRLGDALSCCDLHLATDDLTEAQVLEQVVAFLRDGWPALPESDPGAQVESERKWLPVERGNRPRKRGGRRR
jgi:hypothetical protein